MESQATLEIFQLTYVVLFMCQMYWSFVHSSKHNFSQITIAKSLKKVEFIELPAR